MLMCKFVLHGVWLSTFSRDAMRILCLSQAGRWWRAEFETGELKNIKTNQKKMVIILMFTKHDAWSIAVPPCLSCRPTCKLRIANTMKLIDGHHV